MSSTRYSVWIAFAALLMILVSGVQADNSYEMMTKWGSSGSGDGQFNNPLFIAVDNLGDVYVTDSWNHRIQKFDTDGKFLGKWGSEGTGDGEFDAFGGIAVNQSQYFSKFSSVNLG